MKPDLFSRRNSIILLLALGIVTHALWFGHPNSAVFDEVHFGKFISAYFTHEYYFDIHPPLGKLILAGWGKLWGYQPGFSFANIGEVYPDKLYIALRFLPMLAGALLPLVVFGIARQLKLSPPAAVLAGVLVALDNALLVQSRLILLDSFLLLFGFTALWCYFKWRNGGHRYLLAIAGALGGMAMAIKWTGASFLTLIVILEVINLRQEWKDTARRRLGNVFASLIIIPALLYFAVFIVHFSLLSKTGAGDAFMTPRFQSTLTGSQYAGDTTLKPMGYVAKTVELNVQMYQSNQRLTATHPYSSKLYTWPLMMRPIFYWVQDTSRIYLLGNPFVWWGSSVAVLVILVNLAFSRIRSWDRAPVIMAGAWLLNIVPFIGINRVMFLYHYLTALVWAILMLAYLIDHSRKIRKTVIVFSFVSLALFIFFAPLSYGLPLSQKAYDARVWFASWR